EVQGDVAGDFAWLVVEHDEVAGLDDDAFFHIVASPRQIGADRELLSVGQLAEDDRTRRRNDVTGTSTGTERAGTRHATRTTDRAVYQRDRFHHVDIAVARQRYFTAGEQTTAVEHFAVARFEVHHVARVQDYVLRSEGERFARLHAKRNLDGGP